MLLPMQTPPVFLPPGPSSVADSSAVFVASALDDWLLPQSAQHSGLLFRRPFCGAWDDLYPQIDKGMRRFERSELKSGYGMATEVKNGSPEDLSNRLHASIEALLADAGLPEALSKQIHSDAVSLGKVVGSMCPSAPVLEVKIEIFGKNTCSRWHQDKYVARAIVSYTGEAGTEYTDNSNVDFWELKNYGNNQHITRDTDEICAADVGDMLFIKGTKYPTGANGLVHKAPKKQYRKDGRIVNRLVLKIDVPAL
mgnify:CR=1 FL=1